MIESGLLERADETVRFIVIKVRPDVSGLIPLAGTRASPPPLQANHCWLESAKS